MAPSRKRPLSPPALVPNPFIKKRNLAWSLESPSSYPDPHSATSSTPAAATTATAFTSAPPADNTAAISTDISTSTAISPPAAPRPTAGTTAEIESGAVQISDHLAQFTSLLSSHQRPTSALVPRLSISGYSSLYQRCAGSPSGAHFVIHQHDHPVAGTHYDLRLQINETSSVSWAIMYGLPGDANSSRLNRNATETRIHSLWNHLIETASAETGSLIIWDTGTYSVLPRRSKHAAPEDPSSPPGSPHSSPSSSNNKQHTPTAQSLLHAAFQDRKIRLRLHGTKLPDPYVINIRLTKTEDAAGRSRSSRTPRTRRRGRTAKARPTEPESTSSDSDESDDDECKREQSTQDESHTRTGTDDTSSLNEARRKQQQEEDAQVRLNNAYVGASNTIGSVYQRRWYLSLDRRACGFTEKRRHGRTVWEEFLPPESSPDTVAKDPSDGSEADSEESSHRLSFPFYVRGPHFEQSVVTGRLGEDVLRDEGVTTFVPRKGWTPVMK
ncbi:DNA polymerase ligase domain-containing protein [Trichoderma sp. SZMC 28014]